MPMIPEAVVAMLSVARLGAIHSVVFGGFAEKEFSKRIVDANPVIILTASAGIEPKKIINYKPLVANAIKLSGLNPKVLLFQRKEIPEVPLNDSFGEKDWEKELAIIESKGAENVTPVPISSNDPLYLLYTSGSTGTPKGVVRECGGHAVAAAWSMQNIFGMKPGDVFFCASDIGWVVGHTYIVYAPLLSRVTTVLYEGKPVGTPTAGKLWDMVEEYKINAIFTAPTSIRVIKREDPKGELFHKSKIKTLRAVFLAGERSDPATLKHFGTMLGVPMIDNYWQTETGWPITASCFFDGENRTKEKYGSAGLPCPGYNVVVLESEETDEKLGNLALKLPLPPGCATTLWKNHSGYLKAYLNKFPGYFDLTDAGKVDDDAYVHILSRTDDVINVAGHRLSTGSMESCLSTHPNVAESAVVAVHDKVKGELPIAFVVLKSDGNNSVNICEDLKNLIRGEIGAIASLKSITIVPRLPKTRSGKVLRRCLRQIGDGQESFQIPATIEDSDCLEEIKKAFNEKSFLKSKI
ncbi:hypothetical protein HDU92_008545 [Lobulomyces angularis]|nr:hypothetical protein HDU92_008545 [Lobulomyces angularis]